MDRDTNGNVIFIDFAWIFFIRTRHLESSCLVVGEFENVEELPRDQMNISLNVAFTVVSLLVLPF